MNLDKALIVVGIAMAIALVAALLYVVTVVRRRNVMGWVLSYLRQDWREPFSRTTKRHLLFCFVDHFEPRWNSPAYEVECRRVGRWRTDYPTLCQHHRDADGKPPVHSFFFPEEEYRPEHLDA